MAIDRAALVAAARRWIGTPYVHQASVRGVGCDCIGLLRGVWREANGTASDPEQLPAYSMDWAESTHRETLYQGLKRHLAEIDVRDAIPGDALVFRMLPHGPAKHCGLLASNPGGLTIIHSRQNKRVSEERYTRYWQEKTAYAFRVG